MLIVKTSDGATFILDSISVREFMELKKEGDNLYMEKDGYKTILFFNQVSWVSDDPGKIR